MFKRVILWLFLQLAALAAIDNFANFAFTALDGGIDSVSTTATVTNTAALPTPPFNAVIWNNTDYSPDLDPDHEIVRVTEISGNDLTITRAQEGTSAAAHNTVGKTYLLLATVTAKTFNEDIQDKLPSGSDGEWLTLSGGLPDWASLPPGTNIPNLTVTNGVAMLPVSVVSATHSIGVPSSVSEISVDWTAANDALSGVASYRILWSKSGTSADGSEWLSSARAVDGAVLSDTSLPLSDGEHYFHIVTVDRSGNVSATEAIVGPYSNHLSVRGADEHQCLRWHLR